MTEQQITNSELRTLSDAVERWFEFYEADSDDQVSQTLCNAAVSLFKDGYRRTDEIATILIGTYIGPVATKINAPSSSSIH